MSLSPFKLHFYITRKGWMLVFLLLFIKNSISQRPIFFEHEITCNENLPQFCHCNFTTIICDCNGEDLELNGTTANNRNIISIKNCNSLTIEPQSLYNSGPLTMNLENINELSLESLSFDLDVFNNPDINLKISNVTIPKIPRNTFSKQMHGRVLTGVDATRARTPVLRLSMRNTTIAVIEGGAFGNTTINSLSIINSTVVMAEQVAINNRLVQLLEIANTNFLNLSRDAMVLRNQPSVSKVLINGNSFHENLPQFLSGTINGDVYITNNTFRSLKQSPWNLVILDDAFVNKNSFDSIPKNGLHMQVKNRVSLTENIIGRLQGNALQWIIPRGSKTALFISGNIIENHEPMSLCLNEAFKVELVVIKNNLFRQKCTCNITNDIANGLGYGNLTIETLYEDKLHQQWLQHGKCIRRGTGVPIDLFLVQKCLTNNRMAIVLMLVSAAILITMAICVIVAWRRLKYRNFTQGESAEYHSFSAPAPPSSGFTPWSLVQPDTRTYQETEIHVLFDKAKEIEDTEDYNPEKESSGICEKDTNTVEKNMSEKTTVAKKKVEKNTGEKNMVEKNSVVDDNPETKENPSRDSDAQKITEKDTKDSNNSQKQPSLIRQSCPVLH